MKKSINRSLYKSHRVVYTDPVSGKFSTIRFISMAFVFIIFFSMPWIKWNASQAFLFDIMTARLYVFGLTFWPEDFFIFAVLAIFLVLSLFAATVYTGRVWCGFLCPQSIWLRVAAFFTRLIEGKRNKRQRQDLNPTTLDVFFKKFIKHGFWLIFSFVTSFTFIGYFVPISLLSDKLFNVDFNYWSFFWILFFLFLTYFNIGWFREQFCFLVCPYARLQSVMFDENTLIVAYDVNRGEKRGSRKRNIDYRDINLGDCVDCKKCVTCCPTGIDIRDGLQMECISCAACIDACNAVMASMGYKPHLISYARESELINNKGDSSKARLFAYIFFLCILFSFFIFSLHDRQLIQFSVTRSQLQLYNVSAANVIENVYLFKVTNKTQHAHAYRISVLDSRFKYLGIEDFVLSREETVLIDSKLLLYQNDTTARFIEIFFKVDCLDDLSQTVYKKSQFVKPV